MPSQIVMLAGEPEYRSHLTMRPIASLMERELGARVRYHTPSSIPDEPDFAESSFGDLSDLEDAELLIIYTRFRRLPDDEMKALESFLERGGAVVGLRTSTHAFRFAPEEPWADWNLGFGRDVLGSPWISHHGHDSSTEVTLRADAPVEFVRGLPDQFHVRSWLYHTELQPWCRPILDGAPVDPQCPPTPGPVAWYGEPDNRRRFYTSLGHAEDLQQEPVRRLLCNAVGWAVGIS
ncbi:ThuA domain-containing protein [Microlunatus sp. Gsoil 973]|uniref:ThuA domain-containing protein n=1 Tax=Microlunatus sp. Gsoil 973 TaxID=2672569 RepID=UPI0018A7EEC4|nr:ThuA domain-containing protein [Microlunatus sp. Gsoil 973]